MSYNDKKYKNFGPLHTLNDDILFPGYTIPKHEHKRLDILGYLIDGQLEHWDSCGSLNEASVGQVQHMWCGESIWHTEKCISETPARYLQIWFTPNQIVPAPYYEIYNRPSNEFTPLNIKFKNDMTVRAGLLTTQYTTSTVFKAYLYVISGSCQVGDQHLNEGDGGELFDETIVPKTSPHIMLFEM